MAKDQKEPPAQAPVGEQLIDLVGRARPEDLEALDASIRAKERELESLRAVRKLLAIALGVQPPPGKPGVKRPRSEGQPAAPSSEERRAKCVRYIQKNGPTPTAALCRLFDIPNGSSTATFDHEWFERTDRGVALTAKGNDAARRLAAGGG